MKVAILQPSERVAIIDGDDIFDLEAAAAAYCQHDSARRSLAPSRLMDFISAGQAAIDFAAELTAWVRGSAPHLLRPLAQTPLGAPWPGRRIAAAGGNFADHFASGMTARGRPMSNEEAYKLIRSDEPFGYWKLPGEAIGPEGDVPYPSRCQWLDYEGEVAVIIGKRGRDISIEDAMSHIWGVTLFNDWSIRSRPKPSIFPFSFNLAKNFDGATSVGPWIVIGDVDPGDMQVKVRVNGQQRQSFSTRDMIYSFAEYISFLSEDLTLMPGDMIVSGTGAGTAADVSRPDEAGDFPPDLFLNIGDVVEVEVDEIGILRNRISAKLDAARDERITIKSSAC